MSIELDSIKNNRCISYIGYSVVFFLFFTFCFGWRFTDNQTGITGGDCLVQHYRAFVYYGKFLRTILKNVFILHNYIIPQFDINIGEGSDIIQTFCYYVIGDCFSIFSVLFTEDNAYFGFNLVSLLRLYLAGISFVYFCEYNKQKNKIGIIVGTICYVFAPFVVLNTIGQVIFLNPYIFR